MDRVQIAAIALAVALLALWAVTTPQMSEPPQAPSADARAPAEIASPVAPSVSPQTPLAPRAAKRQDLTQARIVTLENDALRLELTTQGARLRSIQLPRFKDRVGDASGPVELVTLQERGALVAQLGSGPLEGLEDLPHEIVEASGHQVRMRVETQDVVLTRTVAIDESGYGGRLELELENRGAQTLRPEFTLVWFGMDRPADALDRFPNYSLATSVDGTVSRRPLQGISSPGFFGSLFGGGEWAGEALPGPVDWTGIDSQYFLAAAIPENPREARAQHTPIGRDAGASLLSYPAFDVPSGHRVARVYRLYLGPKLAPEVAAVDPRLDLALQVGWAVFRPLVDLFNWMLQWIHDTVISNYGVAIILLTFLLRLATFPLTQQSMKSMKRLSLIGPEMKALQERHKEDRDRLQQEMMALYRRKGMNPFGALGGGCLPMLIQLPFLFALYFALQSSIHLRHAHFMLWINDLSAPENLLSVAGVPVRLLPVLMGGSMLLQMRLTPSAGMDPQQRQMMMWMNLVFVFMFYTLPSGLVLYWFVSNVLGILQQLLVNRLPAGEPAKA